MLEAAARLKTEGLELEWRIAGDGPLLPELQQIAGGLGLCENVTFCGFVTDTAKFLAGIDIFVLPSLFEGLGVAALEAMAAGKPVIATRVGGLAESVVDQATGLLVPAQDSAALAAAIARLVKDDALAAEMGRRGAQRVRDRFTLEKMADANEKFYYDLLGEPS